ncbi:hypothetical protein PILCRDRAFT_73598 [Piloderma croceum F 1598]|uniref:Major facilitator superfamily (MFS) profile domain-containing protein n=1 Tax=Piloderma croceum (strain F 1598) TaxID=765440 RepID=A0A0C3BRR6_PILCF|nr:hypothetical protein PILCRDRAFT_73598 [Piloderma croceum F 1598]
MSSEETPLLIEQRNHNAVYNRFTRRQKRVIVAVVSWAGLLPLFVSGSFIPTIPQVAYDLDSSGPVVSLAVSLSILAAALGSLTFAANSTYYGRRPVYLVSLPLLCAGSLGVALSRGVPELMALRFLQAIGSSAGLTVGSGVIGDIYKLEERGTAMGVFFGAVLLGPAIAPICGGLAAHYASWRDMQFALLACGLLSFLAVLFFLPETSHPQTRGIDKARMIEESSSGGEGRRGGKRWKWVWINPLASLWLLRSPNLLASMAGMVALLTDYVLLVPLAYTIGKRYNITNEAIIGACFLPAGLGNIIGAPLAGRISDRLVIQWRKRRSGEWVPEDRLRGTLFGGGFLVPVSVLCSGFITHYVEGNVGLALNLVCLFFNGLGVGFFFALDLAQS